MIETITVETLVNADLAKVWEYWNEPEHIREWMHASEDWECRRSANDVRVGGKFSHTLAAKDGSSAFDLNGTYTKVEEEALLEYTLEDGRKVSTAFTHLDDGVKIVQTFEMEHENAEDLQRSGWQATLDSFKSYVEK